MHACTFFGHRDCPSDIEPVLRETLINLIKTEGVTEFLVGNSGNFDKMVFRILLELENSMYNIHIIVYLAYLPKDLQTLTDKYVCLPEGFESVPPRFAIDYRNKYMLHHADFVVTYTVIDAGGAAKYEKLARRKKKKVINIAELMKRQDTF